MALEIERKFLVRGNFKTAATRHTRLSQGYIAAGNGRTVRVRISSDRGFLTIKGPSVNGGLSRYEFETEISLADARDLLQLAVTPIIDKVRWIVPVGQHEFEVDEFLGDNAGLIVAEVELQSETEPFERPDWLGQEVTGQRRYYNSSLTTLPYCLWDDKPQP
ncbi:MAG: CYTH domain-containing protein [Bacteroidaceae bacterium]|nr:CYTH domain-containing protein [Bacteroidaceae bacterium]MCF0236277.1 CYTH domain-containing protein [Bacteroidaceae bacterium]